jgi:peptidoglycan/LPS O-acetylase OafA/YrhL
MVALTHWSAIELPFGPWGGNGVAIFFVLSGYLLWKPVVGGSLNIRAYILRRTARILPAWWFAAVVFSILFGGYILPTLFMKPTPPTYLTIVWTLHAEVMFYIVLPFLALIGRPLAVPIVLGLISLGADYGLGLVGGRGTDAEAFILFRFWSFALGMLLAAVAWRPGTWALALGIALLCIGAATNKAWGTQHFNLATYGGAFFVVAWSIWGRPPLVRFWAAGAAISYALYLWHEDLMDLYGPIGLPLAFVVASASYVLLERPVLRWAHRRSARTDRGLDRAELRPTAEVSGGRS